MSAESDLTARLDAELEQLGVKVTAEARARWVQAVAGVVSDLHAPGRSGHATMVTVPVTATAIGTTADGETAADVLTGSGGSGAPDDGPWVWRPDQPLPALGSGPLDGLRLAVKDLMALAGRPLGAGSAVRAEAAAEQVEAAVVTTLRRAGARLVGSVKLHEFAFGVSGVNAFDGTPINPAAPGRVPGGSSSGSAAVVAAGLADVALGTDTGGSCRIPAACCGVVGFKPGYGRIELDGVFPLAPSLDHVGWLARDVATATAVAVATGLIAPVDTGSGPLDAGGGVLGVARNAIEGASAGVKAAWLGAEATMRAAGWELVDVDWPAGADSFAASTAIMFAEAAHVHRATLTQHPDRYGEDVRARLVQGRLVDLPTYLQARERQRQVRARCRAALAGVVAVIGPTLSAEPPTLADAANPAAAAALVKHTRLANLTGFPALSIPVPARSAPAVPEDPIPFGIQVEAASEESVLRVGAALEALLDRQP